MDEIGDINRDKLRLKATSISSNFEMTHGCCTQMYDSIYVCISLPFIDSYLSDTKFALEF